MALPRFVKLPGHYVFDYKPMYYDERKEELAKKEKEAKREFGIEEEKTEYKSNIKGQFKNRIGFSRHSQKTSNITLVLLASFLGLTAYLFFYTDTLSLLSGIFVK